MRFRDRIFEALIVGLVIGLADLFILELNLGTSRGAVEYLPPSVWFTVPLSWTLLLTVVAVLFAAVPWRALWIMALTFAGPGLLLLSRAGVEIYRLRIVSPFTIVATWFGLTGLAGIVLVRLGSTLYVRVHHLPRAIPYAFVGALVLGCGATWAWPVPTRSSVAAKSVRPNVILIFLDTLRYDDVARSMPNLSAFGNRSITFENAWAPAPWTIPSHLAVLTGQDPWRLDYDSETARFIGAPPSLAKVLSRDGYSTAAIFANPLLNPGTGITDGFSSIEYTDSLGLSRSGIGLLLSRSYMFGGPRIPGFAWMSGKEVIRDATRFVQGTRRPYFLALNFTDAHYPYYLDPSCRKSGFKSFTEADRMEFLRGEKGEFDIAAPEAASAALRIHSQYRAAMTCLDRSLGLFLQEVGRQPDSNRTIIAVVGDHGEQFGEHGFTEHGNTLYRQVLHVPLMISVPGLLSARVDDPVSITDLNGTLLEAAGMKRSADSVLALLDPRQRRPVISEQNVLSKVVALSVVNQTSQLVQWKNGRYRMFDYKSDPNENRPVASTAPDVSLVATLEREWRKCSMRGLEFHAVGYFQ